MVGRVAVLSANASWGAKAEKEIKTNPVPLNLLNQLRFEKAEQKKSAW